MELVTSQKAARDEEVNLLIVSLINIFIGTWVKRGNELVLEEEEEEETNFGRSNGGLFLKHTTPHSCAKETLA